MQSAYKIKILAQKQIQTNSPKIYPIHAFVGPPYCPWPWPPAVEPWAVLLELLRFYVHCERPCGVILRGEQIDNIM